MNIAFGTALILFLLFPGFAVRYSFLQGPYSRKVFRPSITEELFWSILPAVVVQLLGVEIIRRFYEVSLSDFYYLLIGADKAVINFTIISTSIIEFLAYQLALIIISLLIGYGFRILVLSNSWDKKFNFLKIKNDWYYLFGLTFNSYTSGTENLYKYNGKEEQEETGWIDYGARMYDPQIAQFISVDPLADIAPSWTPYHYVRGNPINRVDPTGLTDFALNKETGEITQVGDPNDDPDRIVKTDKDGNVKRKGEGFLGFLVKEENRGKAKVALGGIEKGILEDGQNFKTTDQVIDVGGEGQASLAGVEDFVTRFSEHVGVEIAGAYLSQQDGANAPISKVYIDEYQGNQTQKSTISLTGLAQLPSGSTLNPSLQGFNTITAFHTHPSNLPGVSRRDVERPSGTTGPGGDLGFRDNNRIHFYNFLILTRTATYPSRVQRIPYTNWNR